MYVVCASVVVKWDWSVSRTTAGFEPLSDKGPDWLVAWMVGHADRMELMLVRASRDQRDD